MSLGSSGRMIYSNISSVFEFCDDVREREKTHKIIVRLLKMGSSRLSDLMRFIKALRFSLLHAFVMRCREFSTGSDCRVFMGRHHH